MQSEIEDQQLKTLEWEILPPEEKENRSELEPLFRWLALIMDNLLRVPGTQFRFGLDPLLGLLPGLGDTGSALISAMALVAAARRGIPKILLARMSLNILINEAVGIIPDFRRRLFLLVQVERAQLRAPPAPHRSPATLDQKRLDFCRARSRQSGDDSRR